MADPYANPLVVQKIFEHNAYRTRVRSFLAAKQREALSNPGGAIGSLGSRSLDDPRLLYCCMAALAADSGVLDAWITAHAAWVQANTGQDEDISDYLNDKIADAISPLLPNILAATA